MAKLSIRVGFNQAGYQYSVKDVDAGTLTAYSPGGAIPGLGAHGTAATSACELFRVWQLSDSVRIENASGVMMYEGNRGDYLLEGPDGRMQIVKVGDIRDGFDLASEISRIYRTPTGTSGVLSDNVFGRMKNGQEF